MALMSCKRFEAETATIADVLQAQAMRLTTETELLRARQHQRASSVG